MTRSFITEAAPAVVIDNNKKTIVDNDVATFGDYQFSDKLEEIKNDYDKRIRGMGEVAWSQNKGSASIL